MTKHGNDMVARGISHCNSICMSQLHGEDGVCAELLCMHSFHLWAFFSGVLSSAFKLSDMENPYQM